MTLTAPTILVIIVIDGEKQRFGCVDEAEADRIIQQQYEEARLKGKNFAYGKVKIGKVTVEIERS